MEDDFFEYFRTKDLSKVKKFNFKKTKVIESPIKEAPLLEVGNSINKGISNDTTKKISKDLDSNNYCFKQLDNGKEKLNNTKTDPFLNSLYKSSVTSDASDNLNSIGNTTIDGVKNTFLQKKVDSKTNKSDSFLDSLYKATGSDQLTINKTTHQDLNVKTLQKSNEGSSSPSLLSGSRKFKVTTPVKVSKYFSPKKSNNVTSETPLKNLLNSERNDGENASSLTKQKKFVFKKKPRDSSFSSVGDQSVQDLDLILSDYTPNGKHLVTATNNYLTEVEFIKKPAQDNTNSINDKVSHSDSCIKTTYVEEQCLDLTLNDEDYKAKAEETCNMLTSNTQSLEISDADYMDDEEFERRFGYLSEQSVNESTIECKEQQQTKELLNEISNINWNEDEFSEEPTGFRDRDDDSDDFRGHYEHTEVLMEMLHQKFGLRNFRPHQQEIINASLTGHDCFVLMPTGGGKSLCYQLPAILTPGVTVIISPLRALISDQVDKMNALDIAAAHLCSDVSKKECDLIYMKLSMKEPTIKLLYLTPEKIGASRGLIDILNSLYQRGKLARFVIDEVHCLSQWGHDFRPNYKQLNRLRIDYKEVPIICLTATATKPVENDVINILGLKNVKRFIRSFNRPNIKYEVVDKSKGASEMIANLIKSKFHKKSGIIYCLSRKDCEKLADQFITWGVKAKPYHAGMADNVREAIQREWMQDRFQVIIATIAFGMGIDKPDVRFVIHNSIPKSVEAFYQESGRAGRDGEISYSYLFYCYKDVSKLRTLMRMDRNANKKTLDAHEDNLRQMVSFAENVVDCRRYLQLLHLGEHFDRRICIRNKSTTCDNCENINKYKSLEVTKEAKELCAIVKDLSSSGNITMIYVADVYRGSKAKKIIERGHDKHPQYSSGASMNGSDIHRILKQLLLKHVLQDFCCYAGGFPITYIKPGPKFYQFYNSDHRLTISVSTEKKQIIEKPVVQVVSVSDNAKATTSKEVVRHSVQKQQTAKLQAARKLQLAQLKVQCHEELLEECRRLAMERNLTLSSVMNLSAIKSMSDQLPSTKEEMLKIQHVTIANYGKYGDFFLKITQKFREKHDAIQPLTELKKGDLGQSPLEPEDDFFPSDSQESPSGSGKRGVKRKANGNGKKSGFKKKRSNFKKRKTRTKASGSGWKSKNSKRGGGGSGLGFMPIPNK